MAGVMERRLKVEKALEEALRILKTNKEKVPEELLVTKYRKSYGKLKQQVRKLAEEYAQLYVLYGIRFQKKDRQELADAINKAIRQSSLMPRISRAVYGHQDLEELMALLDSLEKLVWDAAMPYMKPYGMEDAEKMAEIAV